MTTYIVYVGVEIVVKDAPSETDAHRTAVKRMSDRDDVVGAIVLNSFEWTNPQVKT